MPLPRIPFRMWSQLVDRGQIEALETVRDTNRLLRMASVRRMLDQPVDRAAVTGMAMLMMRQFDETQRRAPTP